MTLYIAIACEGFSFRQEYVQDCSVFMVGFFLHTTVKDMSSFEVEEWMFVLDRNAIKSIARAKGQRVSLYFFANAFF